FAFAWSHILYFFPIALWAWLISGFVSIAAITARRKLLGFILAGFLATGFCFLATMVYFVYSQGVSETALDELIKAGEAQSISPRFDIDERSQVDLFENASSDYTVIYGDSMFESYEWKVRFVNGTEHNINMERTSLTQWHVHVACTPGCKPNAP
ncbi:MAG: hypothetical protein KA764_01795, partial [Anaerolineales bacterium]|nr:hypothetical protein [Anaerolineales bacterium]